MDDGLTRICLARVRCQLPVPAGNTVSGTEIRLIDAGAADTVTAHHARDALVELANLARANPSLRRHLAATIRAGRYSFYTPASAPRSPGTLTRTRMLGAPFEQRCTSVERHPRWLKPPEGGVGARPREPCDP